MASNFLRSSAVHQSGQIAVAVELASLIVEAMRQLVPDNRADMPVVLRIAWRSDRKTATAELLRGS